MTVLRRPGPALLAAAVAALTACASGATSAAPTGSVVAATAPTDATAHGTATGTPTGSPTPTPAAAPSTAAPAPSTGPTAAATAAPSATSHTATPGNPAGGADVPAAGRAVDVSHPDHVIGDGTPASCTSAAVLDAVAAGGVTVFRCGADPVTIRLTGTAKVANAHPDVVLDGGGLVTLSGGGSHRILYQDTCDQAQGWTTSHCQDQPTPRLTVQHIGFTAGNSTGDTAEGGGGGAILVRGGALRVVDATFTDNRCDAGGADLGGAAIRALSLSDPVYVVGSTFTGGRCSNGGALSSIGVSWVVANSVLTGNSAIGSGANPAAAGTPGGGSGGAIYTDGNTYTVDVEGSVLIGNHATEGGGAIFFVSNDRTGTLNLRASTLRNNPSDGFETSPGIFYQGGGAQPEQR